MEKKETSRRICAPGIVKLYAKQSFRDRVDLKNENSPKVELLFESVYSFAVRVGKSAAMAIGCVPLKKMFYIFKKIVKSERGK